VRGQSQGFTLLEIAVALAVLGIGVVTVMQIFQGALRLQNKSAQQSRVVMVARQVLDEILSEPMDPSQPCGGHAVPQGFECEVSPVKPEDMGLTQDEWEELDLPDVDAGGLEDTEGEEPAMYKIELKVPWQSGADGRTFVVRTYRYYNPALWSELDFDQ
jgi:prepilin-type N-terminal cleavage/methylation domain-containing protein